MPLARISTAAKLGARSTAISDAIQSALAEHMNVPAEDRFHVITEHASGLIADKHYLGIERSDDIVFIQVFLRRGRTVEQKKAFYSAAAQNLLRQCGYRSEDVFLCLVENDLADWSFGNA